METDLTKQIKRRLRGFRPAMASNMRTIRWAEEVSTPSGYVDVIRFEDYVERDESFCQRFQPEAAALVGASAGCKKPGGQFPNSLCQGCVWKRTRHVLGILTTCFEVKITLSDFKSAHGHNFHGNYNYYAVPADIANAVLPLVPAGIGLIAYYPDSSHMTVKKAATYRQVDDAMLSRLLYDALKKWVDGAEQTSSSERGAELW